MSFPSPPTLFFQSRYKVISGSQGRPSQGWPRGRHSHPHHSVGSRSSFKSCMQSQHLVPRRHIAARATSSSRRGISPRPIATFGAAAKRWPSSRLISRSGGARSSVCWVPTARVKQRPSNCCSASSSRVRARRSSSVATPPTCPRTNASAISPRSRISTSFSMLRRRSTFTDGSSTCHRRSERSGPTRSSRWSVWVGIRRGNSASIPRV